MFRPEFILSSTTQLEAAMFNKTYVAVWQEGELVDYGQIEKVTDDAVYINDGYYLKAVCEFKVR